MTDETETEEEEEPEEEIETQMAKALRIETEEQELRDLQLKVARHSVLTGTQYQWEDTQRETASAVVTTMRIRIPYDDSRVYVVTSVAASDDTTGSKLVVLYSEKAGERHLLKSGTTSAAKLSVDWQSSLITGPNQSIVAVFTTPTASDKLVFTAMGYWTNKGKLP